MAMTLKEKFKERLYNQSHDDSECLRIRFENIDKVIDSQEVIADEFAIEFADWLEKSGQLMCLIRGSKATNKLLEIYKKEKGL
jgi:plasmid maintenance system antidote protein VapI